MASSPEEAVFVARAQSAGATPAVAAISVLGKRLLGASPALLLLLSGCGPADRPAASQNGSVAGAAPVTPASDPTVPPPAFEGLAPPGWTMFRHSEGSASYRIIIPEYSETTPITGSGAIALDGRVESSVKLGRAVIGSTDDTPEERAQANAMYEDYPGYRKVVSVDSYGYNIRLRREIHGVAYYNFDLGISCHGHSPGQSTCYWGSPRKRMQIYFESEDMRFVLPYVLKLAEAE